MSRDNNRVFWIDPESHIRPPFLVANYGYLGRPPVGGLTATSAVGLIPRDEGGLAPLLRTRPFEDIVELRVCLITNLYPPMTVGGAEVYLESLASQLRASGHSVAIITNCPGTRFEDPSVYNIAIEPSPVLLGLLLPDVRIDRAIKVLLKSINPDIVHIHNTHSSLGFGAYAAASELPTVVTIHDYHLFCLIGVNYRVEGQPCNDRRFCSGCAMRFYPLEAQALNLKGWRKRAVSLIGQSRLLASLLVWIRNGGRARRFQASVDRVICVSDAVASTMRIWGISASRLRVLCNGLPDSPRVVHAQRRKPLRIGYIGRVTSAKGIHILLEALSLLESIDFHLTIAGTGPDETRLKEIASATLPGRVTFTGQLDRPAVEDFYASIDIIVVPSVWPDPLPVVVQEAMARRKLVIGSDIGGISEMLAGGRGTLFESANPGALARALAEAQIYECRNGKAESAFERFNNEYRLLDHVQELVKIYAEVLAERTPPVGAKDNHQI